MTHVAVLHHSRLRQCSAISDCVVMAGPGRRQQAETELNSWHRAPKEPNLLPPHTIPRSPMTPVFRGGCGHESRIVLTGVVMGVSGMRRGRSRPAIRPCGTLSGTGSRPTLNVDPMLPGRAFSPQNDRTGAPGPDSGCLCRTAQMIFHCDNVGRCRDFAGTRCISSAF